MSVIQPPQYMAGTLSPDELRAYAMLKWLQDPTSATVIRPLTGVIPRGGNLDLGISVAGSNVTVAAGGVVIAGSESGSQYGYEVINDAPVVIAIPTAPVGQTRRDLIVVQVRDAAYSTAFNDGDIVRVPGTAASSGATLPTVPNNCAVLAEVTQAGTGAPTATSKLGYTCAPGGIRPARGGTVDDLIPPQFAGQYRDLNGALQRGDAPGGSWSNVVSIGEYTEVTAALKYGAGTAVGLGTGGTAKCRYQVQGKSCRIRYHFTFGATPSGGSGGIYTELPPGLTLHATGIQKLAGAVRVPGNGDYAVPTDWALTGHFDPSTSAVQLWATFAASAAYMLQFRAGGGTPAVAVPTIPNGSPIVNGTRLDLSGVLELA